MAPYLGKNLIPDFVDSRRGSPSRGRGGRSQGRGGGRRGDRANSPTRHSDGERYKPYKRYDDDRRSKQGARSAPLRGPPVDRLNFDGFNVKDGHRSDSGYSNCPSREFAPPQPSIETQLEASMPPPSDVPQSMTLSGLDSLEKLRQFKSQIEASGQVNMGQEIDTSSLARMAEMFLQQQRGTEGEDPLVSQILATVSTVEAMPNCTTLPIVNGTNGSAGLHGTAEVDLRVPRPDSAPAILSPHALGVNVVPSPTEPGEVKEDQPIEAKDRATLLKERLRERQQPKPITNGQTNGPNGDGPDGPMVELQHLIGTKPRGVSPRTIGDTEQPRSQDGAPERYERSLYDRNPKNFVTYRALPPDSPEAQASRHGPYHYHSNVRRSPEKMEKPYDRSRSPEKMSRSVSGGYGREPRESRGDQMLRQMAHEDGRRASRMSPKKPHHQPPWEQRKNAPSGPNGYNDGKYDREEDAEMRENQRSPWRDSFLREPFKPNKAGQSASSQAPLPPRYPPPFPGQPREPREYEAHEPPMTSRSSNADQEILATLAGLKAQIAKLEAQLPSASPMIIKPIASAPNDRPAPNENGHRSYERPRSRSPVKSHSPGVEVMRSRTFSGSRVSHPYQPLSPRRPSNASTRLRQSYEDRPPWKGESADSYSRDDTMKRRDEDRYGGYKVSRESSEYRYEFVPSCRQTGERSQGGYEKSQGSRNGSHDRGGHRGRGRGRGKFRGRGGY